MPSMKAATWLAAVDGSWPYSRWSWPIGALVGVRAGRDHVGDRSQVEVDAGLRQLPPPPCRLLSKGRDGHRSLVERRRDDVETGAGETLDQATFLVGGHEEPDAGRGLLGRQGLDRVGERPDGLHASPRLRRERE